MFLKNMKFRDVGGNSDSRRQTDLDAEIAPTEYIPLSTKFTRNDNWYI